MVKFLLGVVATLAALFLALLLRSFHADIRGNLSDIVALEMRLKQVEERLDAVQAQANEQRRDMGDVARELRGGYVVQ